MKEPSACKLLTASDVAASTGLSEETLAQWRSQRRGIPYLKVGRSVRYDAADVQAYLGVAGFLSPFQKKGDRYERLQKRECLLV
jgi:excisionase family DNA binding protein